MFCPKCGHQTTQNDDSNTPEAKCPACGIYYFKYIAQKSGAETQKPNNWSSTKKTPEAVVNPQPSETKTENQKTKWTLGVIIFLMLVGLKQIINNTNSESPPPLPKKQANQTRPATTRQIEPIMPSNEVFTTSIKELISAYDANTIAADSQFKDKRFNISGDIDGINTDLFNNPYLTLRNPYNRFMNPQFKFDKSHADKLSRLSKGQYIWMLCTGDGDIAKIPMSKNCKLITN